MIKSEFCMLKVGIIITPINSFCVAINRNLFMCIYIILFEKKSKCTPQIYSI